MQRDRVSIVIPTLNEEWYIGRCMDSIIANDYPKELLEVNIVDGMSSDRTRDIVRRYEKEHNFIRLFDNEKCLTPVALNIGIKNSTGDVIVRMDAHTTYSKDYVSKCVETLNEFEAANVGGIIKTLPSGDTILAKAIALSLAHPFGVGGSHFRLAKKWIPCRPVDTVPFGCFRRELFDKVGYYNEEMPRVEDIDLNKRIAEKGGKIILNPEIVSYYYARGNLLDFWRHNFDNGYLLTSLLDKGRIYYSFRHFVPLFCLCGLILLAALSFVDINIRLFLCVIMAIYLGLGLYFSFKTALRQKDQAYLFVMPPIFGLLHVSYGIGSLFGLIKNLKHKFAKAGKTLQPAKSFNRD